ncbi:MAG TPA: T9SS type A sorting domain-containing protein, partial [Balneolaceae bacterium]|nr:T9SS type A sorting domain-containing protein [Balneolaceae bacterium]
DFGGAIVQTASTGGLSLNNASDQPTLLDNHGNVVQSVSYGGAGEPAGNEKQSITRNPDITGNFEEHTTADKTDNSLYSPGTKIDGKAFGSNRYAISLRGHEGWRFIASPTQNTTFSDMFSSLWTQGIPGSDAASVSKKSANIYSWHEHNGGGFGAITGMSDQVQPGKGYIIYVYKDDNLRTPGVQGGFPKIIKAGNTENSSPVRVAVNSNDNNGDGKIDNTEGFNLLGNPFSTDISVDAVIKALQNVSPNINHNLYVWDPNAGNGNGAYKALAANGSGHTVAPFQAFFIRYTAGGISGKARFSRQKLAANKGISFVGRAAGEVQTKQGFKMYLGNGHKFDTYSVEFRKHGAVGEDKMDAFKLFSLNANAISFFSTVGDNVKIATNVLPPVSAINGTLHIPLGYKVPKSGQYEIRWSNLKSIPDNLKLYLIDHSADNKINMRTAQDYRFNITKSRTSSKKVNQKIVPSITESTASVTTPGSRFEIVAIPASNKNNKQPQPAKQQTKLSPNYPNPFSSQTSLNLQLKNKVHVKMTIFNIVGQKVAKLVDRTMNAGGPYQITWKVPADMPSGIYICKVTAGRKILTRKMTLVK